MSEKLIKEIQQIESVEATAVISYKGNVWQQTGTVLSADKIKSMATYLLRIAATNKRKQQKLILSEIHWLKKILLARFSDGFLVMVIFQNPDVLSLLRITLNVTVANLLEDKSFLKWLKKEKFSLETHFRKGQFDEKELGLISKLV